MDAGSSRVKSKKAKAKAWEATLLFFRAKTRPQQRPYVQPQLFCKTQTSPGRAGSRGNSAPPLADSLPDPSLATAVPTLLSWVNGLC